MSQRAPLRALGFELGGSETCPPAPHCTFPAITSSNVAVGEIGKPFSFQIQLAGAFTEINLIGLPDWATFDPETLLITGTPDEPGTTDVIILANNACGEGVGAISHLFITISAALMIWGNWESPLPVAFTEYHLIHSMENWAQNQGGYNVLETTFGNHTIEFSVPPAGNVSNWYQVIWMPNDLLGVFLSITVQGFTFNLQPANNTPYQDLTIAGTPGKLFVSAAPNNGGFTFEGGNEMLITVYSHPMIWGNWESPLPGVFTENHIINALDNWAWNTGGHNVAQIESRQRSVEFSAPPDGDWYQVIWIPTDMLDVFPNPPLSITVQGFTFNLQPANNTAYQDLTISGVPGKIFVSAAPNNGGFTVSGGNEMIIA